MHLLLADMVYRPSALGSLGGVSRGINRHLAKEEEEIHYVHTASKGL